MKNKDYDCHLKFVMVGNSVVGKSYLLLSYANDQFNDNYMPTIGADFRLKSLKLNNKIVKLQIWDTSGQEKFRTIVNTYLKNSHAVFLIFDLENKQSFDNLRSYWVNEATNHSDENAQLILVANKADTQKREVSQQQVQDFIRQKNLLYFQTSAKTGHNVKNMFQNIAADLASKESLKVRSKKQCQNIVLTINEHYKKSGIGSYISSCQF